MATTSVATGRIHAMALAIIVGLISLCETILVHAYGIMLPTSTTTASRGAVAACTMKELGLLNDVLQFTTDQDKLPSECQSLKGVAPMYFTPVLFKDDICKHWVKEMMKLRNCGNPALDTWKAVMETRLTECARLELESSTNPPQMTDSPTSVQYSPRDIQANSTGRTAQAPNSFKKDTRSPASTASRRNHAPTYHAIAALLLLVALY